MHENLTKQKRGKNIYPGKAKLLYCKAIKKKTETSFQSINTLLVWTNMFVYLSLLIVFKNMWFHKNRFSSASKQTNDKHGFPFHGDKPSCE